MLKDALKEQFRGGLAMLAECVEKCPEDLWTSGQYPRYYWRIALHAVFFTHLQIVQDETAYAPWPGRPDKHERMWLEPAYVEPYELPDGAEPLSPSEVQAYIAFVDSILDSTIDGLNLEANESGYRWYPNFGKLSHVLMNLRHIQGHVGQLSELLMARGIDLEWIARSGRPED